MKSTITKAFILSCLFLAGAGNGTMDAIQFHDAHSRFENPGFWDPATSWANKWAKGPEGGILVGEEAFWGSSRWFVSVTDGWHLMKLFQLLFLKIAVLTALLFPMSTNGLYGNGVWKKMGIVALWFAAVTLALSAGFHLTYTFIF